MFGSLALLLAGSPQTPGVPPVAVDDAHHTVTMRDRSGRLELRLSLANGCVVDRLRVAGRDVEDPGRGVGSGIRVDGRWITTREGGGSPRLSRQGNVVRVDGIEFGGGEVRVRERWTFTAGGDAIRWRIDRTYLAAGTLDDTAMPMATFRDMTTWTGARLGTGGVAWAKLFDAPNATYGVHTGSATFWKSGENACLRLDASVDGTERKALRFTRELQGSFTMATSVTRGERTPRYGKARFRRGEQDVWTGFPVAAGESASATVELSAPEFAPTFGRGDFKGLDTAAITELLNTIGRIGVIDEGLVGTNGWYSGYACLHEPWLGAAGLALDDSDYVRNYARALDDERDHAAQPDGMVKSRWCYTDGDAQPGTYDAYGYYEAQWGRLEDTQSSYVNDVADEFDLNGDLRWVRGQKRVCEAALEYLLKRDTNGNGLVEMATDSHTQRRSSDWMDIVWASYENAFVNAQLYRALLAWADVERLLGDAERTARYYACAAKLKASFNRPTTQGGFWDAEKGWYVYWREPDGSVHGDNLVPHVNLTALADGLCDDPARRRRLLDTMESRMKAESLLSWPSCFEPYAPGEAANTKWPDYENGDLFLAWASYGVRAYAAERPSVALKYVRAIVGQYRKDGLAFQRYLRSTGKGAGDDILSNNANVILGLYRDVYGIQPKHDRLVLAPHLSPELNGTRVEYTLRGKPLTIRLSTGRFEVACRGVALASPKPFGSDFGPKGAIFFAGEADLPAFTVTAGSGNRLTVDVREWGVRKRWSALAGANPSPVTQTFDGLKPGRKYQVVRAGTAVATVDSHHPTARIPLKPGEKAEFELRG